ncbi:hypothetical protein AAVH_32918 [Aphelenchoides avenae]|nr:hypothetical protein AAVH_32918 [Aphelenchus avenae]
MVNGVRALCALFDCEASELRPLLMKDDKARKQAVDFLKSKYLRTNYKSKGTSRRRDHAVTCTDLTPLDASEMYAYEGILNIRVRQHYFAKHKIWLDHHQLPCIEERHASGHSKYFPLEMVNVNNWPFANWRSTPKDGARVRRPKGWITPCSLSPVPSVGECEHGARIYPAGMNPWSPDFGGCDKKPSW